MRLRRLLAVLGMAVASLALAAASTDRSKTFKVTADTIEGCSCPLFCECYFNEQPANPHMCQFNNVYKFAPGSHYGDVGLDGVKVWMSGDLGGEWGKKPGMPTEWVTITFEKSTTPPQRNAITKVLAKVFPVKWGKVEVREDDIEWNDVGDKKSAHMKSGKGDIELAMWKGADAKQATVLKNVKYAHEEKNGFTIRWTLSGKIDEGKDAS